MMDRSRQVGSLGGWRAQNADRVIRMTEQIVTALQAGAVDLTSAQEALDVAKALHAHHDYSEAVAQAKRAETLAATLNERFTRYMVAWTAMQACMEDLRAVGFPTDRLEAALAAADKETVHAVEEAGALVPNYHGAAAMIEQATEEARALLARAKEASHEILTASLAVEALADAGPTEAPAWIALRLEEMVEQATRDLALGNVSAARRIASEVEVRAEDSLAGAFRVWEILDMAASVLDGLGAEGPALEALFQKVESAREALRGGTVDRDTAAVVARRLSDEVADYAGHYPQARRAVERAERVYAGLQRRGFSSYEVEQALTRARRALGAGQWAAVRDTVGRASESFLRLRRDQDALARSIDDLDERVALLKGFDLPLLSDIEEIVGRAKEEVRNGRLSGANEDLLLASLLMEQATRNGS